MMIHSIPFRHKASIAGLTAVTTIAIVALATGAQAQAQGRTSVAPQDMQIVAPALAGYTDDVLFGEVWRRTALAPRDRSLVTVSALIAGDNIRQASGHMGRALDNGLTPAELVATADLLSSYASDPRAAANVASEVLARRSTPAGAAAPLSGRDQGLVAIAALIAKGDVEKLPPALEQGLDAGITRAEVGEVITHLAFYSGWPRAVSATAAARPVLERRADARAQAPPPARDAGAQRLEIVRYEKREMSTAENFTGPRKVESSFQRRAPASVSGAVVTFAPGARTAWHAHPLGQTLIVVSGCGWVQVEGEPIQAIRAGDVALIPPGAKHWHGASSRSSMAHAAVLEPSVGRSSSTWMEAVSNEQYGRGDAEASC